MGSRLIRDRSKDSRWWLMVGLFTLCVVGWSLAFSFKAGAADTRGAPSEIVSGADQVWNLSDFNRISISGSPQVTLVQGDIERVSANGPDKALSRLEVFTSGGELIVRKKRGRWWNNGNTEKIELVIEFIDLEQLNLSGSAELRVEKLRSPELNLKISGSGDTHIEQLLGDTLNLGVSGSADINVAGTVTSQVIRISGSADYEARDLATQAATVRISGSGDAEIAVSSSLDARISGSGSVRYLGDPKVQSKIFGSGDIRSL